MTDPDRTDPRHAAQTLGDQEAVDNAPDDEDAVRDASHMSPRLMYQVVRREGDEELDRSTTALFWSAIAAGLCISFSVLGEAVFNSHLPDSDWLPLVESLGYTFGFVIVILGRMQLFTENTLTTVLPLLARPSLRVLGNVARLWGTVLGANVIGCLLAALFIANAPTFTPDMLEAVANISREATGSGFAGSFAKAVPAGLLIAALVWILASGTRESFLLIVAMTWLIAAGGFTHIVAGTVEMFYLNLTGELGLLDGILTFFIPVFLGNVFGGTVVFSLITWGQVRQEVNDARAEEGRTSAP